ncbi:MAG: insulinase family protein [Bacteroidales bacterium]|nr:insulinase family protein [Bacteroidales bacterium]MEE1203687.1 insulinase family protein [Bacteroidales bacterium]
MRNRVFLALVLCVTLITTGFAQNKKAAKVNLDEQIKLNGKVRTGKLDNGLTYYVRANNKPANRAEFQIAINAGSVLEEANEVGLAHFTEHMGFNGTKHYPGNTMIDDLEKEGIVFGREINAYTGFDQTVYMVTLPTDNSRLFDMGLKILDGWASGMLMTGEEIDKERGVIIEEWRMSQGGSERLRAKTWGTMLKGSKYAERLPIGTLENLQNFKYDDIRGFYKKWYRPDNMAVIVVGDFDADEMEQKIIDYFTMTPKACTPTERPVYTIDNNVEPLVCVATDKEATSTQIQMFYKHPAKTVKTWGDYREQYLVYGLFEQMFSERLHELGEKKSCPYMQAGAGYGGFLARPVAAYQMYVVAKEGKAMEALEAMMLENRRLQQHGFLQTELDRAKESLLEQYARAAKEESKTESGRFASELVDYFLDQVPAPGAVIENKWAKQMIESITLEEVNALIGKWMTEENFVCTISMPEKKGVKVPTEEKVLKAIEKCKKANTKAWVDNVKTEPFLAQEPKAGKIESTSKNEKFDYTEYTLSNGAKVIVKKTNFKNDEILTYAVSNGGTSMYEDKDIVNAQFAANIVDASGIGTYDHSQLMKFMKGKSFGLTPSMDELQDFLTGSCSPKDFETQMQYFYLFFTAPRIDKEVLASEVDKLKTQINMVKNMPEFAFQEKWIKSMYPNNKRSIIIPTEAQLKQLNADKMLKMFKERFSDASDFTFVFVGNIDEKTMLPLIEKYIGGLPSSKGKKAEKWQDRSTPFASGVVDETVYAGEANKGLMTITFENDFDWSDRLATKALDNICSIKLTETIREELGGTYSPSFSLSYEKYPQAKTTAMCYYTCDPTTVDKLTNATFEVLDKLIAEGPEVKDLDKVKEQLILERKGQLEKNGFWLGQISGSRFYGYEMQTLEEYSAAVNALTIEDIKAVAAKYLKHDGYVRVSLKPASMKPAK